jgi:hypothetical protein
MERVDVIVPMFDAGVVALGVVPRIDIGAFAFVMIIVPGAAAAKSHNRNQSDRD